MVGGENRRGRKGEVGRDKMCDDMCGGFDVADMWWICGCVCVVKDMWSVCVLGYMWLSMYCGRA